MNNFQSPNVQNAAQNQPMNNQNQPSPNPFVGYSQVSSHNSWQPGNSYQQPNQSPSNFGGQGVTLPNYNHNQWVGEGMNSEMGNPHGMFQTPDITQPGSAMPQTPPFNQQNANPSNCLC
jgi:hypothetical protein